LLKHNIKFEGSQHLEYTIKIPYAWLNNPSRVYPIFIDPSISGSDTDDDSDPLDAYGYIYISGVPSTASIYNTYQSWRVGNTWMGHDAEVYVDSPGSSEKYIGRCGTLHCYIYQDWTYSGWVDRWDDENPNGLWTMRVHDVSFLGLGTVWFDYWYLTVYYSVLSNGYVTPPSGTPSTTFTYYVTNSIPYYGYVQIDGGSWIQMNYDGYWSRGYHFSYSTTLSVGTHNYRFYDSGYGSYLPTSGTYSGPTVTYPQTLSNGYVTPSSGTTSTTFTYYVTNSIPYYGYVQIDGGSWIQMNYDGYWSGGYHFSYSTTLSVGTHNYRFYDSGYGNYLPTSGTYSGPTVTYPQTLSNGYVSPSSGTTSTTFTYYVTNSIPYYGYVQIDRGSWIQMNYDGHWSGGYYFSYSTTLSVGSHNYRFYDSGYGNYLPTSGTYSGPTVTANNPPNTPSTPTGRTSGYTDITYSYSTSGTDPDGDNVKYIFDWDDGTPQSTTGFVTSGSTASAYHSWSSPGTYYVKAKTVDVNGAESGWSSSLEVTIRAQAPKVPLLEYEFESKVDIPTWIPVVGGATGVDVSAGSILSNAGDLYIVDVYGQAGGQLTKKFSAEGRIDGKFIWRLSDSNINFKQGWLSGDFQGRFPVWTFPLKVPIIDVGVDIEIYVTLGGGFTATFIPDGSGGYKVTSGKGYVTAGLGITAFAGIDGWIDIYVEGWGYGSVKFTVGYSAGDWYARVDLHLEVGLTAKFIWWEKTWSKEWDWGYPSYNITNSTVGEWQRSKFVGSGISYGPDTIINDMEADGFPSIASDSNGNLITVWTHTPDGSLHTQEIYYSMWDGTSWSAPKAITNDNFLDLSPVVAYTSAGKPMVVWVRNEAPLSTATNASEFFDSLSEMEIYYSMLDGSSWSTPQPITDNTFGEGSPSIASDNNGRVMVIWVGDEDSNPFTRDDTDLYYAIWDGSWGTPQRLTNNDKMDIAPDVAYDSNGNAIVVWTHDTDSNSSTQDDREICYSIWESIPSSWTTPMQLTNNNNEDKHPSITFDSVNNAIVAWVGRDNTIYSSIHDGSSWSTSEAVSTASVNNEHPEISSDSSGNTIVIWRGVQNMGGDLYYSVRNTTQLSSLWSAPKKLTNDTVVDWQHTLTIDKNGNAVVVWSKHERNFDDDLYYLFHEMLPDLKVDSEDITFSETYPAIGDPISIDATICNIGDINAESILVSFYDGDPNAGGTLIANQIVNSISPEACATASVTWNAMSGTHNIYVVVDPLNDIAELSETNNMAYKTLTVLPELKLSDKDIAFSNDEPVDGEYITISAIVHNPSGINVNRVIVEFYDGDPTTTGTLIDTKTISVAAKSYTTVSTAWMFTTGAHHIYVAIDPNDIIGELDETNNVAFKAIGSLIDLIVEPMCIIFSNYNPVPGTTIKINVTIINNGTAPATGVLVKIYENSTSPGSLIGSQIIGNIDSNWTEFISIDWTTSFGVHKIIVLVDPSNIILEIDETNNIASKSFIVTIAPNANAGMDKIVYKGEIVHFDASSSSDSDGKILLYEWDFESDGIFDATGVNVTYIWYKDGIYTVTLKVTDDDGVSDIDTVTVTVLNVAPIADAGPDQTVNEGDVVQFDGTGSYDPDGFSVYLFDDFEDGDYDGWNTIGGTPSIATGSLDGSGNYLFQMETGKEVDGAMMYSDPSSLSWQNYRFEALGRITDGNDDWSYLYFFFYSQSNENLEECYDIVLKAKQDVLELSKRGQGQRIVLNRKSMTIDKGGVYHVAIEVEDGHMKVFVNGILRLSYFDNSYTHGTVGFMTRTGGGSWTWVRSHFDDIKVIATEPSQLIYKWDFDASDGIDWDNPDATGPTPTHTYGDNGVYIVTLMVTDDDGGVGTDALTVTVNNVAPTLDALPTATIDEDGTVTFSGHAIDPGSDDLTFEWTWEYANWCYKSTTYLNEPPNPDSYPSPEINPQDVTESASCQYGDNGMFTVTLTVTDDDGASTTVTTTVTVNNVAPTVDALSPITINEGQTATFTAHAIDPGSDDLTFEQAWEYRGSCDKTTIYYNNGVSSDPYPSPTINPRDVTEAASCKYGDNGVFLVTLTVTDDDGASTTVTTTITVNNIAPTVDALPAVTINEGQTVSFTGHATDPGSDDLTFEWTWEYAPWCYKSTTYLNEPPNSDGYPSPEINPRDVTDSASCQYGDNGVFTVTLTVTDDDGGSTTATTTVTVNNVAPILDSLPTLTIDEGGTAIFSGHATDPGSDDLMFAWNWAYRGVCDKTTTYLNFPPNLDLYPSPEVNPRDVTDSASCQYGDNGVFTVTLTVTDDDGGVTTVTTTVTVNNVAPIVDELPSITINEGETASLSGHATDPGSDDLTFKWTWEYRGPCDKTTIYLNSPPNPDLFPSPEVNPRDLTDSASCQYGDNGVFTVTLTVTDDDGGVTVVTTTLTVNNVAPEAEIESVYVDAKFTLRVAGEKWHDVSMTIYEDGKVVGYVEIERYPGNPDDQSKTIALHVSLTKRYTVNLTFDARADENPINGQIFGANPVWVILDVEGSEPIKKHHTFNVRHGGPVQSCRLDFTSALHKMAITFIGTASDPGSDDLTFTWDWGDGTSTVHTYYNDGVAPDPYPSPWGNYPVFVRDVARHTYAQSGTYIVTLTVEDDDGGNDTVTYTVIIDQTGDFSINNDTCCNGIHVGDDHGNNGNNGDHGNNDGAGDDNNQGKKKGKDKDKGKKP